jgi:adenosylmethionine-8-amino-7-oxononanoate aminotransferase
VANLAVWEEEDTAARIAALGALQEKGLDRFRDDPRFENLRRTGTIAALDIVAPDAGYLADIGPRLYAFFQGRDLLLRPLGNTLYVLPPYCTTDADLAAVYDAVEEAADMLSRPV